MKVKRLHLKNGYKRFYDLKIDLGNDPKKIVALVGPNGCGKSSILDSMLFHNNAYNRIGNKSGKDYTYHSMNQSPNYDYQNVTIEFVEGNFINVRSAKKDEGKENTIFSFRSPYRYNSSLKVTQTQATNELRKNSYGATYSGDIDDKMEENYRRLYIKFNKYLNENDCRPSEAKTKIIGDLNNSLQKCLNLEIASIGSIESNEGSLYFLKEDHPSQFEFNVLSSGEKEVVDILLDLYLRKEEFNDSVFLIDEPELHLNTSIQKNLLIEIDKLIGENCQIWVATHSIGFLRALQDELNEKCQILRFEEGINWASTPQELKPIKKSLFAWKEIFETALDDLTGLISPRRIIYCEGKDKPGANGEDKGFDAKVYNNIYSERYSDTLFISSGGNTELDHRSEIALTILTKVFEDVEIWVLKDRDVSSGKENDENDRQVYLKVNSDNHRILNRWEIENYLYDKEVLNKFCLENGLLFKEEDYDNFVNDIVNQNLKDATGRIKNYCSITTSINAEKFKLQLSELITSDMNIYKELEDCIFERK